MKTKFFLSTISATILMLSCKNNDDEVNIPQPEAFTFTTSSAMSTGATSITGTNAPAGYTWSQIKAPQIYWGYGGTIDDRMLAEDFQVPSGEKWKIDNFYFYTYQTGFSGTTFPVNEFYFEIYSSDPSVAGAVKVYGDITTNRYVSAEDAKMYRILQGEADNLSRKIYKMKIQAGDLNLSSGTYWIKWGSKTSNATIHFYPQLPHQPNVVNNAKQFLFSNSTWIAMQDGGQALSMPFEITGTKLPN